MDSKLLHSQVTRQLIKHRTSLYSWIFALVRNHADADDIFQAVSVAVVEAAQTLPPEDAFLPWAREIARRRILNYFRDRQWEQAVEPGLLEQLAAAADQVEREVPLSLHREALQACLEELPADRRELLLQRYDSSGTTIGELANQWGRSVTAMYGIIKRLKMVLQECIERRVVRES